MSNSSLFKKFLTYFYGSGIGLIIGLFTTIISTRLLSPEDFGKSSMFTLAVNVLMIFVIFGTDQAFVRFYYEEEEKLRGKLLFNTMKIPFIILTVTLIALIIFQDYIMIFLFDETNSFVFLVLIIGIIFQVFYRFAVLVIRMQQKGHTFSLLEIFNKSINLLLIVLLYCVMGSQYKILIYSTVIATVLLSIIAIYLEKKIWIPRKIQNANVMHSQSDIFHFSYPLVLTTLITWLFESFDKIAIRQWSDFEELGLYSAAARIVALLLVVQSTFTTFWTPVCYEHYKKHPEDKEFFARTNRVISLIMFVVAIVTILLKDVIVFLLGSEFREAAVIMPFLIFMPMMYTISETTVIGINFYKKTKWHILIAVASCLMNIIGNIILVPPFGAAGAAVSTGLSYILFFVLRTHIALKYYKVNFRLKKIYFLILCISFYAFQNMIWPHELFTYVSGILLLGVVCILNKADIYSFIQIIKNKRKSVL